MSTASKHVDGLGEQDGRTTGVAAEGGQRAANHASIGRWAGHALAFQSPRVVRGDGQKRCGLRPGVNGPAPPRPPGPRGRGESASTSG